MSEIFDISYNDIDIINDLWEKNRLYHEGSSEYFKESYRSIRFDERIRVFLPIPPKRGNRQIIQRIFKLIHIL
ncbi:hypothetical protein LGL55_18615 [Clostridium tagluense]|uniref:hypothetical protein n=1 Tax=Clostridium tagluense TaxID=360422 RepID=UPI001CF4167B|nr:hypothetical protein [Clostridium tagluense]MCB2317321.1 hypothetical protein [Clostridium tagluense]MCB2322890.1 hypothetical protein [Clostridium tagluense]MCB2326875.1 hypothetical protein [Clostridium tagluense]MCB2332528.1 hypothetical protein [Clostridium tagluense]MCB2366215.1 hypothetical protein [Clostridium tagluense]